MTFYMRNFTSEENFDISKFMNFENDVYDVIASPFLAQISQLPTVRYYYVNEGFHDIDMISTDVYDSPFFSYIIQFYNNDFRETFTEDTVLKLFSLEDLNELYYNLSEKSKE